jgi:glycerophosphoryl diester phosphodiesterase
MMANIIFPALFICMTMSLQSGLAQHPFDLQGHRGARGLAPENSIPAFLKALEYGVTTLELDVVITKDHQIVVSHEPWMSDVICRQPDGSPVPPNSMQQFNIYQMTYEEVQQFDCGTRLNPRFTEQVLQKASKPLLGDVIDTIERYISENGLPEVWYNIETKCQPMGDHVFHPEPEIFVRLLYYELKKKQILHKTYIQSFDVRTLQAMQKIDSTVHLVLLVENDKGLNHNLELLGFIPAVYSPFYMLVDKTLVEQVHAKGMKIIPWTVNDPRDIGIIIDMGVDGLITDYPDRGRSVLKEKGLLPENK